MNTLYAAQVKALATIVYTNQNMHTFEEVQDSVLDKLNAMSRGRSPSFQGKAQRVCFNANGEEVYCAPEDQDLKEAFESAYAAYKGSLREYV